MTMLIALIMVWYFTGALGFIYWWTSEFDLTVEELPLVIIIGITGPIAWLLGWLFHGHPQFPTHILVERRK